MFIKVAYIWSHGTKGFSAVFERDRVRIAVMSGPTTKGGSLVADILSRLSTRDTYYSDGIRTSSLHLLIVWRGHGTQAHTRRQCAKMK